MEAQEKIFKSIFREQKPFQSLLEIIICLVILQNYCRNFVFSFHCKLFFPKTQKSFFNMKHSFACFWCCRGEHIHYFGRRFKRKRFEEHAFARQEIKCA